VRRAIGRFSWAVPFKCDVRPIEDYAHGSGKTKAEQQRVLSFRKQSSEVVYALERQPYKDGYGYRPQRHSLLLYNAIPTCWVKYLHQDCRARSRQSFLLPLSGNVQSPEACRKSRFRFSAHSLGFASGITGKKRKRLPGDESLKTASINIPCLYHSSQHTSTGS